MSTLNAVPHCHSNLIKYVARKQWWHVPPQDPDAYQKRGKFYSSTFAEAEFYGRPDDPERVTVTNPLVGDEAFIECTLFQKRYSEHWDDEGGQVSIAKRFALDARIKKAAFKKGYGAIVLMAPKGFAEYERSGKLPRSIELNVLEVAATVAQR